MSREVRLRPRSSLEGRNYWKAKLLAPVAIVIPRQLLASGPGDVSGGGEPQGVGNQPAVLSNDSDRVFDGRRVGFERDSGIQGQDRLCGRRRWVGLPHPWKPH